jgi:flagellar hook-length control protein FliK
MMQYVATSNTEIAALAAIGTVEQAVGNESSSLASAFELAMRQHANAPSAKSQLNKTLQGNKSSERVPTEQVQEEKVSTEKATSTQGVNSSGDSKKETSAASSASQTDAKPSPQKEAKPSHTLDKNNASVANTEKQPVLEQINTQTDVQQQATTDPQNQLLVVDEQSDTDDDINADSPEEWINLVGQLQSLQVGEANTQAPDLTHLEKWLKQLNAPQSDLANLVKNNPQLQQILQDLEKSGVDSKNLFLALQGGMDSLSAKDRQAMLSSLKLDLAQLQAIGQGGASAHSVEEGDLQGKLNSAQALAPLNKIDLADTSAKSTLTHAEKLALSSQNTPIEALTDGTIATKTVNQGKLDVLRQATDAPEKTPALERSKANLLIEAGKTDATTNEKLVSNNAVLTAETTSKPPIVGAEQLSRATAQNAIADGVKRALDETKPSALVIGHAGIADESLSDAALAEITESQKKRAKIRPDQSSLAQTTSVDSQVKPGIEVKNKDGLSGLMNTQQSDLSKSAESASRASQVLQALSELSPAKQEQVLQALALQIRRSASQQDMADTKALSNQDKSQLMAMAALMNTESGAHADSKDFVSALKAGLSEFKKQLEAGHQPSFDLKSLVNDALAKMSNDGNQARGVEDRGANVSALISQFSDLVHHVHDHPDPAKSQGITNHLKDSGALTDFAKQQVSQFDKALNLHKPEAQQLLAEKVRWMVNSGNLIAEMRLDPAELGSVKVKVAMSSDAATVSFVVQSHHARDALEAATPKLREMLADKGIELGQSSVREEHQTKQDNDAKQRGDGATQGRENESMLAESEQVSTPVRSTNNELQGSIDYFV